MKKLLVLLVIASFASCKSGWNCKARYVNMDTNYVQKHQKKAQPFDSYLHNKYKIKG